MLFSFHSPFILFTRTRFSPLFSSRHFMKFNTAANLYSFLAFLPSQIATTTTTVTSSPPTSSPKIPTPDDKCT